MSWFSKIRQDIANIVPAIDYYETQLNEARLECGLKGNVEKHSRDMPGIVEYRFNQLQELEAILEYLNIEMRKIRQSWKTTHQCKFIRHKKKIKRQRDTEHVASLCRHFERKRGKTKNLAQ